MPYKSAKPIFERTRRTRKDHAETFLKERMKDYEMDLGHVRPEKVTFNELAEDLKTEYRIQGRKSIDRLGKGFFKFEEYKAVLAELPEFY